MLKLVGNKCQVGSYFDQITLIIYFDVNLQNSLFKRLSNQRARYLITRDRMTVRCWCFPGYLYSVSPFRNMLYISWRTCCLKREDHAYHVGFLRLNLRRHCDFIIGRISIDDGDVNENTKKTISLDRQNINSARASRFFVRFISFF